MKITEYFILMLKGPESQAQIISQLLEYIFNLMENFCFNFEFNLKK